VNLEQLYLKDKLAFVVYLYYYQCPDEIVPNKSTSTTLRNPSLAHKHDSAGSFSITIMCLMDNKLGLQNMKVES
jgi:hypothetical protein